MARKKRSLEEKRDYEKRWRENNREKMRVYAKKYRDAHRDVPAHLERKYGITVADKERMWEDQQGLCGVCSLAMTSVFARDCQVEHDHGSGKVRSLTHWYCNIMVGVMEKNPILLHNVVAYLDLHKCDAIVRTQGNNNLESPAEMSGPCYVN